jgi:hypothetical protein
MKAFGLAVSLLCAAGAASAQTFTTGAAAPGSQGADRSSSMAPAENIDRLATLLDLNEGQKFQVKAIFDDERARMEELVQEQKASGQNPSAEWLRVTEAQVQKETLEKLSAVLTETQLKKFEVLRQVTTLGAGPSSNARLQARPTDPHCDSSGRCTSR